MARVNTLVRLAGRAGFPPRASDVTGGTVKCYWSPDQDLLRQSDLGIAVHGNAYAPPSGATWPRAGQPLVLPRVVGIALMQAFGDFGTPTARLTRWLSVASGVASRLSGIANLYVQTLGRADSNPDVVDLHARIAGGLIPWRGHASNFLGTDPCFVVIYNDGGAGPYLTRPEALCLAEGLTVQTVANQADYLADKGNLAAAHGSFRNYRVLAYHDADAPPAGTGSEEFALDDYLGAATRHNWNTFWPMGGPPPSAADLQWAPPSRLPPVEGLGQAGTTDVFEVRNYSNNGSFTRGAGQVWLGQGEDVSEPNYGYDGSPSTEYALVTVTNNDYTAAYQDWQKSWLASQAADLAAYGWSYRGSSSFSSTSARADQIAADVRAHYGL